MRRRGGGGKGYVFFFLSGKLEFHDWKILPLFTQQYIDISIYEC